MNQILQQLLREGKQRLELGELAAAKEVAESIARFLDKVIVSPEEVSLVEGFLKEILSFQQIDNWLKKENKELEALMEGFKQKQSLPLKKVKGMFE